MLYFLNKENNKHKNEYRTLEKNSSFSQQSNNVEIKNENWKYGNWRNKNKNPLISQQENLKKKK